MRDGGLAEIQPVVGPANPHICMVISPVPECVTGTDISGNCQSLHISSLAKR